MKILVPLDGSTFSETILEPVTQLAGSDGVEVHLITVVDEPRPYSTWEQTINLSGDPSEYPFVPQVNVPQAPEAAEVMERALRSAEEYLNRTAERFSNTTVRVTAIRGGEPAEEILSLSRNEGVDLIAMSTHGRSGLGRWVYGSTADRVLQSTFTPLLLFQLREKDGAPVVRGPVDALVVPLDGSNLAESALPHVEDLARKMSLPISLIRVVSLTAATYPDDGEYAFSSQLDQVMESTAVDYLQQRQAELEQKGFTVESRVEKGYPAAAVIDFAEDRGSSLIVMSTHGRSGLGRWILGSVADRVLRASFSPVLVLRSQQSAD